MKKKVNGYVKKFVQFVRERDSDIVKYGMNHGAFKEMRLPDFYPSFLFLLRVPVDLVHVWLKLRVEQNTDVTPDPLTLTTVRMDSLSRDTRDGLSRRNGSDMSRGLDYCLWVSSF